VGDRIAIDYYGFIPEEPYGPSEPVVVGGGGPGGTDFTRGDSNDDGETNIADAIFVLSYLFGGGPDPHCFDAADTNDDGAINIADAITLLGYLFGGGTALPDPFGVCGPDPTVEDPELPCVTFESCP
jgi:hypothetical protein